MVNEVEVAVLRGSVLGGLMGRPMHEVDKRLQ